MTINNYRILLILRKLKFSTIERKFTLKDYKYFYENFLKKDDKFKKLRLYDKKFISLETLPIEYSTLSYLVIRLDGVKFTERFFRKEFIPEVIISIINQSINTRYI
jgi:hypothetical protein